MSLPFRKLSLSGGGVKGVLQYGVLRNLKQYQELEFPDGVWGCSIGAIISTFVAFRIPLESVDIKKYLGFDKVLPKPTFQDITGLISSKGVFSMDLFEKYLIQVFAEHDFDITTKKIGDAHMPLYIVASNITKGIPTVFSKDVSLVEALKCSCCLPGIFKPQELYGQLYVDGGLFVPDLGALNKDGLHLFLTKKRTKLMTPQTIDSVNPLDYIRNLYSMSVNQLHKMNKTENTIELEYPNLNSDSKLDDFEIDKILVHTEQVLRCFLITKGLLQEVPEVLDGRLSDHLK
jgi:predicted patatin/cPLA2 family phospholipase